MKDEKDLRYRPRLSIPSADAQVVEWFKAQSDISNSVRRIVKDAISRYGMVDVDCMPVPPGKAPGRPARKTAAEDPERAHGSGTEEKDENLGKGGGAYGTGSAQTPAGDGFARGSYGA